LVTTFVGRCGVFLAAPVSCLWLDKTFVLEKDAPIFSRVPVNDRRGRENPGRFLLVGKMSDRIWAVRAGGESEADPLFIENGQIAVSFLDVDRDVSALPSRRGAFKDAFSNSGTNIKPGSIPIQAGRPVNYSASFMR
jgi:hypothetical protein